MRRTWALNVHAGMRLLPVCAVPLLKLAACKMSGPCLNCSKDFFTCFIPSGAIRRTVVNEAGES